MPVLKRTAIAIIATLIAANAPTASLAASDQPPANAQAPTSDPSAPSVTTATYGSWTLRCVTASQESQPKQAAAAPAEGKSVKTCEVIQTVQVQGQTQPVAQVALGHVGVDPALAMTVVLPSNISIPGSVRLVTDFKEGSDNKAGFDMVWTRCAGGACFATAKPDADSLTKMRSAKAGSIAFIDAAGRTLAVPLSWTGLTQALNALEAQK